MSQATTASVVAISTHVPIKGARIEAGQRHGERERHTYSAEMCQYPVTDPASSHAGLLKQVSCQPSYFHSLVRGNAESHRQTINLHTKMRELAAPFPLPFPWVAGKTELPQ